jgi:ribonuclease HI
VGDESFEKSDWLLPRALAEIEAQPALWLRGVAPAVLTTPRYDEELAQGAAASFGGDLDELRDVLGFLTVFGDGSGGIFSSDPRRRRCGTAIVIMQRGPEGVWVPAWGRALPLAGRRQTVPRAEIFAFVLALEETTGNVRFVTDHQPLFRAWHGRLESAGQAGLANEDLWQRARAAFAARGPGEVQVEWVASHTEEHVHLLTSERDFFLALGNASADVLAGAAAEGGRRAGLIGTAPRTDEIDAIASLVRRRARKALELASAADGEQGKRPAGPRRTAPPPAAPAPGTPEGSGVTAVRERRRWTGIGE